MLIKDFFNDAFFFKVKTTYGKQAVKRAHRWHEVIEDSRDENEWKKLNKINYFFNQQISYQNDLDLWGKNDYWASPLETIGRGLGDCEDFAIAKFFSLTALGIPEKKLRLMYVRQLTVNEPHMVLIYFKTPKSIPLVLDNYHPKILAANKRPDLKPIYSFNGNGLWMSKAKGLGRKIREGSGVSNWDRLIEKIELEQGQTERNG
ncbi:MAG: transglutaminase [Kangiella sp.]|nr:MAG: transglutaminase [Kangiella sp.]